MDGSACGMEHDLSGHGLDGIYAGGVRSTSGPGDWAATGFDGIGGRLEVPDFPGLSISTTGALTVEVWVRPDDLLFPRTDGSGYVNFLGKGIPGAQEYTLRMYSADNTEGRKNRVSAYVFNPIGNFGAGSYFQDPLTVGAWMHVAAVYDTLDRGPGHETGTVSIYRDGVLRDRDALSDYGIVPKDGPAPLGIGARDNRSYFKGALAGVAVYGRAFDQAEIATHAEVP